MADCPECGYSPYVVGKPHLYAGRSSAGLMCFGPRQRLPYPVTKPLPPKQPPVPIEEGDPIMPTKVNRNVNKSKQQKEKEEPSKSEHLADVTHESIPTKKRKKESVLEMLAARGLTLTRASEIGPPNPTRAPKKRPTKRPRSPAGRGPNNRRKP